MSKELYVSSTPHETKVAVVEEDQLNEVYFERENEYTLAGSIYKGRVTRVLPGMQSAFVNIGLDRDAFLYVSDFLLEEDDDAEALEQVISRSHGPQVIEIPDREAREARTEVEVGPVEAEDVLPPMEAAEEDDEQEEGEALEATAEGGDAQTQREDREGGARKWRGRRRRGRGRFGDRDRTDRDRPEREAQPQEVARKEDAEAEPREHVRESMPQPQAPVPAQPAGSQTSGKTYPSHSQPMVLPGESISKYQPQSAPQPVAPVQPTQNVSPHRTRPSTEYTLGSVQLSPDAMVLPGESLAKYRGGKDSPAKVSREAEEQPQEHALPVAQESGHVGVHSVGVHSAGVHSEEPATDLSHPASADASIASSGNEQVAGAEQHGPHMAHEAGQHDHETRETHETDDEGDREASVKATHVLPFSVPTIAEPAAEKDKDKKAGRKQGESAKVEHTQEDSAHAPIGHLEAEAHRADSQKHVAENHGLHEPEDSGVHPRSIPHIAEDAAAEASIPTEDHIGDGGKGSHSFEGSHGFENAGFENGGLENSGAEVAPTKVEIPPSRTWYDASRGVVEEEEIEEGESELLAFEEHPDLADFEELEEEELEPIDDQLIPAGRQITEAVRDAHTEELATGQYEAEGLDSAEFDSGDSDEDEDGELDLAEGTSRETDDADEAEGAEDAEELEGTNAAMRTSGGNAGYQQRTDRRVDRRGRKGGRRMRGRPHRQQVQRSMPAIADLLKEGQEILVQIAKEPIAKKGARITSHIALPGRFLVYMPTVHHTGVSRKIASDEERQRLKRIVLSERGDSHGGFIVRTAAAGANEEDLRADIRFLINLWTEIRGRAEKSKAPALIYHDLNLVERILRDQVTTSFSAIWVDTEHEYERVLRFVSRFQPSLVKRVKLYTKETPLFEQFNVSEEINKALKSKVWLKSGGYIVIDVNTGKYVGKTARLEDTIVKTNVDAIKEIVRQIRLRDLGGIIVIDFIDMDERKNRQKVMQALEEALKADRAPSKVLQFNDFGLVAITRKRVKQSMERTLGSPCPYCTGTGFVKSVTTVCNEIYTEMRKIAKQLERPDVMLRVNPEVGKALKSNNGRWLTELEELTGRSVIVKTDPTLHQEQFDID